jgi:hypothetical protein
MDNFIVSTERLSKMLEQKTDDLVNFYDIIFKCTLDYHLETLIGADNIDNEYRKTILQALTK